MYRLCRRVYNADLCCAVSVLLLHTTLALDCTKMNACNTLQHVVQHSQLADSSRGHTKHTVHVRCCVLLGAQGQ